MYISHLLLSLCSGLVPLDDLAAELNAWVVSAWGRICHTQQSLPSTTHSLTRVHIHTTTTTVAQCSTRRISEKRLIYHRCRSHHRQVHACLWITESATYSDHGFTQEFEEYVNMPPDTCTHTMSCAYPPG